MHILGSSGSRVTGLAALSTQEALPRDFAAGFTLTSGRRSLFPWLPCLRRHTTPQAQNSVWSEYKSPTSSLVGLLVCCLNISPMSAETLSVAFASPPPTSTQCWPDSPRNHWHPNAGWFPILEAFHASRDKYSHLDMNTAFGSHCPASLGYE